MRIDVGKRIKSMNAGAKKLRRRLTTRPTTNHSIRARMRLKMKLPRPTSTPSTHFIAAFRKKLRRPKFKGKKCKKNIIIIHNNTSITSNEEDTRTSVSCVDHQAHVHVAKEEEAAEVVVVAEEEEDGKSSTDATESAPPPEESEEAVTKEEEVAAAIKIQAFFRGHLARRASRALRSLVKLQAAARGVCVRRQARIALQCMHALVRLQVRVRARHLLSNSKS